MRHHLTLLFGHPALLQMQANLRNLKESLLLDIAHIIADHGAEIAYPTQTLHIQKDINDHLQASYSHFWVSNE